LEELPTPEIPIDFVLEGEDLNEVYEYLEGEYTRERILIVHAAMLATPRFVSMGIVPVKGNSDFLDPEFEMDIFSVAAVMRIIGLARYGMMFHDVTKLNWLDIESILAAFQLFEADNMGKIPAFWVSRFVTFREDCYGECPLVNKGSLFFKEIFTEIEYCDKLTDLTMGVIDEGDIDLEMIGFFRDMLAGLFISLEDGKGSVTLEE